MSNPAYKKIVEQMWADGRIVPDEISTLVTLQQHLGVCSEDAAELERSVMGMTKEEALVSGMGTNASTAPAAPAPAPVPVAQVPATVTEPTAIGSPVEPEPCAKELPKQQADLLGLGITLLEAGDTEEADEQFTAVLKYDPTNSTAWMAKAAVAAEDDLSKALSYLSRAGFESASVDLQGQACTWFDSALSELIRDETGWKHQVDSAENLRDLPEVYKHLRHCKSPAALKALKASLSEAFSAGIKSLLGFCREEQQYHEDNFEYRDLALKALNEATARAAEVLELEELAWQVSPNLKRREMVIRKLVTINSELLFLGGNKRFVDRLISGVEQEGDAELASRLRMELGEEASADSGASVARASDARDAAGGDTAGVTHEEVVEQAVLDLKQLVSNLHGFGWKTTGAIARSLPPGEGLLDAFAAPGASRTLVKIPGIGEKKAIVLLQAFKAEGGKDGLLQDARDRLEAAARQAALIRMAIRILVSLLTFGIYGLFWFWQYKQRQAAGADSSRS